jgi:hypothetical protein
MLITILTGIATFLWAFCGGMGLAIEEIAFKRNIRLIDYVGAYICGPIALLITVLRLRDKYNG